MTSSTATITVLFFGACREALGISETIVSLSDAASDNVPEADGKDVADARDLREIRNAKDAAVAAAEAEDAAVAVSAVFQRLKLLYPQLSNFERSILFAVNEDHARADSIIRPGDTLAIFPPVSGG